MPNKREIVPEHYRASEAQTAVLLLAAMGFLYCFLFVWPLVPIEGNGIGDSLLNMAPGQRMYQGELIYRDVFEFLTPGTALVNLFMFKLFGLRPWIPNLLALSLGVALVWFGIAISKKMMTPSLALLPSAIFVVSERAFLNDPTHNWYSVLATLAAISVLIEMRTPTRIAFAGFLCGIGASFTQTRGLAVVVGFFLYLWWESRLKNESWRKLRDKEVLLLGSFLAAYLIINGYFIWEAGPVRYFWCTVVFVLKYHHKEASYFTSQAIGSEFPQFSSLRTYLYSLAHWIFLFAFTPFIYLLFFAHYWRRSSKRPIQYWERPMLVAIVGSLMLLGIAPEPDGVRMAVSAFPAIILLCWFLDSSHRLLRALSVAIAIGTIVVGLYSAVARRPQSVGVLAAPWGQLAFTDPILLEEDSWIQLHTRQFGYFYEPLLQDAYFYLDLRNPTPLSAIESNGFTPPDQVAAVIRGLEQHRVRYILWSPQALDVLPKWQDPHDDHLQPLRDYLGSHYKLCKTFQNLDVILERAAD